MDPHESEHGHGEAGAIHLPDPSVWPLVVGAAALLLGLALVWWSRDRSNDFAGPVLGVAAAVTLLSAAGWATEDARMRRKAERQELTTARAARYTQVVAFAIADGQLDRARQSEGVLHAVERSDLRDLAGFQDLRIVVSPAATGPAQALVETTWSAREGLATYDETRQTLLDVINDHADEVVPGSVQVFDMEVVRDTKDTSFRFGFGAAAAVLGSLIVGGFMLGAGLTAFEEGGTAAAGTATPAPSNGGGADAYAVTATDNKFDKATLQAPPSTEVTYTFKNDGKVKHNIHFLTKAGGDTLAQGAEGSILDGGKSETLTFTTPAAGSYYFQCDLHPDQMKGTFEVKEGAPAPGASASNGGAAAGSATLVATDNKFDKTTLTASAGKEYTLDFENKGKVKHNVHILTKAGGDTLAQGAEGAILDGGKSETLKFTPPTAGKFYYQCDLHPDQMNGTFTVS